ncbi:MAG: glycosyltransferase family 4 protein [Vulcanimicrobiota bacterium]
MKVALVCPYDLDRPGGVRSHILGLGLALRERGHQVEVIGPNPDGEIDGLPLVGCGRGRQIAFGGTHIDLTWASWSQVGAVAARGYDVMHFHTIWNPLFPFQLASLFRGCKVATWHDAAGPNTPWLARRVMPWASAMIRRLWLRQMIAVSPLAGIHLKPGSFHLIPNGLWVPPLPPEGERRRLLYVGRLEPRKGLPTLLGALERLGAEAPPLWVAGEGHLRQELEQRAARLPGVEFLGEVTEQRKWELLRQARLLIAPSLGGESFGIVLTEAMACGAPPLAADNPGYREVLRDRFDQLIFPVGDEVRLAERIRVLCSADQEWSALREWGLREWQRYDWRVLAAQVEEVYRRALG